MYIIVVHVFINIKFNFGKMDRVLDYQCFVSIPVSDYDTITLSVYAFFVAQTV